MKLILSLILVFLTNSLFAADIYNGNEYSVNQVISSALDVDGAFSADSISTSGTLTVVGSATVQGNAFSVGTSTFVVTGGKVGVGTAIPATKLHLSSGTLTIDGTGDAGISITANGQIKSSSIIINSATAATNDRLTIAGPATMSDIRLGYGAGGGAIAPEAGSKDITVYGTTTAGVYSNPIMTFDADVQRVGIGTTTPASKMHISSSTIRIDGTGAPTTGGALCLNSAGAMAKCTSAIDASGNCTCP